MRPLTRPVPRRLASTAVEGSRAPWLGYNASLAYVEGQIRSQTDHRVSLYPLPLRYTEGARPRVWVCSQK